MAIEDGYALCFNEWALDNEIKNELGLLLIISGLTAEKGYCFAKNDYLANLFGTSPENISRKIKKLEDKNYITCEYEKRGAEIIGRKIKLTKIAVVDRQQKCGPSINKNVDRTINKNVDGYNIYNNTIDNNTIHNRVEISNQNNLEILEENKKIPPTKPRVSAPTLQAGLQLDNKIKGKLKDFEPETKKCLVDYCLMLRDEHNMKTSAILNRIDEVCRKARNIPQAIQVICQYNINGSYYTLFLPNNLSKQVSDTMVHSEAYEGDFIRDEDGNIEEIW